VRQTEPGHAARGVVKVVRARRCAARTHRGWREARLAALTERELEIAHAIGEGLSNAQIASRVYLSIPTVKAHVSAILGKLDAGNRVQVALLIHDAASS
jgi:DNA-binding NarL/FixJ family response regulator